MSQITFDVINAAVHPDEFKGGQDDGAGSYENGANWACKAVIGAARRDPIAFKAALDEYRTNPYTGAIDALLLPEERETLARFGLTGFMWGWAVGTAAWLLEQPPVPNGAILTLRVTS